MVRFVEDTKTTIETLLFKTNATMGGTVICGGFPLIYVSLTCSTGFSFCTIRNVIHNLHCSILNGYFFNFKWYLESIIDRNGHVYFCDDIWLHPHVRQRLASGWFTKKCKPANSNVRTSHLVCAPSPYIFSTIKYRDYDQ